jgi:IS605 OrfB family transposase
MYKTIPIKAKLDDLEKSFWVEQCEHSNSLYNSAIYQVRQLHYAMLKDNQSFNTYWRDDDFKSGWKTYKIETNYYKLDKLLKQSIHYKSIAAQAAQQVLKTIGESISSYNSLVSIYYKGEGDRPSIPKYRKSGGLNAITYPKQALRYIDEFVYLPCSASTKKELICETKVYLPEFIDFNWIKELTIRPYSGEFWVDFVIDDGKQPILNNPTLDYNHAVSIDHGVKCWLSVVTTTGKSFIVNAPQVKTTIFRYQQRVKDYKTGKQFKYWDEHLDKLTGKRNVQIRDAVNKTARFIINRCLKDGIGNLIIGWNERNKTSINLGKKNNYEIVSMPTARLIKRLKQLSQEYGIKFHVTSEEYTSKASFIDRDSLPKYGEKPVTWKPSGKRTTRDTYCSMSGIVIHADLNAAANILRKILPSITSVDNVNEFLKKIELDALTRPKLYDVFNNLKKAYRKTALRKMDSSIRVTSV